MLVTFKQRVNTGRPLNTVFKYFDFNSPKKKDNLQCFESLNQSTDIDFGLKINMEQIWL